MGWVGWSEEQTLATDMQSIETAYRGRFEMIRALAGREIAPAAVETETTHKNGAPNMTPDLFMAMFGGGKP